MKIEKITYQVTVPVASFQYDKIGVEASVDSDSEDISECFDQLKRTADGLCRQAYPHLYVQPKTYDVVPDINIDWGEAGVNRPEEEENISLLDRINNSTNAKELKSWELLIKVEKDNTKKQVLQDAYNIKMAALNYLILRLSKKCITFKIYIQVTLKLYLYLIDF